MTNDSQSFRAAMAQLGSAVCILTTDGPGGRYGITASAVTAVSDDPPSLIVCVNRGSGANAAIKANGRVCVNVLSCDQEDVSSAFSDKSIPPAERFDTGHWGESPLGNPILAATAACFDCEIDKAVEYGTHTVFFCHTAGIEVSESATCLIYQGRAYHRIEGFG
ncbi:MAG: flavin reductase family protein [Henriciella sp.]|uniref:flavin reductase family protein n=1 Tax=Henriciella sp. TaxID=1968823 RepID=UPI00261D880A|nr:flavin reductase family protein [Henriciella sp.]